jgi:glucose/arabinose dehydrogenase
MALQQIEGDFESPITLTAPYDGSDRLFVLERDGRILVRVDGIWQATPFLDISHQVESEDRECGMTGLALAPGFGVDNHIFYVYYTSNEDLVQPAPDSDEGNDGCDSVVSRFQVSDNPNIADADSEERLLVVNQPTPVHQGGDLAFGPDGYLYISLGDGSHGADPHNAAQRLDTLLGKILRIDVSNPGPYTIPADNPFYTPPDAPEAQASADIRPEIWAYGLRNPYRISFDRVTGALYIADVGEKAWEEINWQEAGHPGGANYGWRVLEGPDCYPPGTACTAPDNYVAPIHAYPHEGVGCTGSIIGGHVYRGGDPALHGTYIFGDYCTGKIYGLRLIDGEWRSAILRDTRLGVPGYGTNSLFRMLGFGEDSQGNLFALGHVRVPEGPQYVMHPVILEIGALPVSMYLPLLVQQPELDTTENPNPIN